MIRLTLSLSVCLSLCATVDAAQVAGYGGDGSRVFTDCTPPTSWGPDAVRWEVTLPSWGTGSPIVIGDRLFVVSETGPHSDWPILQCLDIATGEERWRHALDHLEVTGLDAQAIEQVRADWHEWLTDFHGRQRACLLYKKDPSAAESLMAENGWEYDKRWRFVANSDKRFGGGQRKGTLIAELQKSAGLTVNVSNQLCGAGFNAVGLAYPTPISDGTKVYAATAFGSVFAFDLDGKLKWIAWVAGDNSVEGCNRGRSPILWDAPDGSAKLLLYDSGNVVRAIDRETGAVRWTDPIAHSHTIVTPVVLDIGDTPVLWTAGPQAYRLPDGKKLTIEGWSNESLQVLVKSDERDVAFFCGSGEHCGWAGKGKAEPHPPAAVRFSLVGGDTLKAAVLWHGGDVAASTKVKKVDDVFGGNGPWMVYHDGRFYHRGGAILDAATGALQTGGFFGKSKTRARDGKLVSVPGRAVPDTRHLLQIANGHVYGLRSGKSKDGVVREAVCGVYTLDGKLVAENVVRRGEPDSQQLEIFAACSGKEEPGGFSIGCTFTFGGSSIFFRSYASIICIKGE